MNYRNLAFCFITAALSINAFAKSQTWNLNSLDDNLVITNDSDHQKQLKVHLEKYKLIGGDVLVRPNSATLVCDGATQLHLEPGEDAVCILPSHKTASLTLVDTRFMNWGSKGTYEFFDV